VRAGGYNWALLLPALAGQLLGPIMRVGTSKLRRGTAAAVAAPSPRQGGTTVLPGACFLEIAAPL
jgi:hypothetical protein